jgi:tRNA(Ile)-lysidine synthase
MEKRGATLIAMGHHLDDLVETRLLRLFRGTGLTGLRSMEMWKKPNLRPFLHTSKAQLLEELRRSKRPWFEDASNVHNGPKRNWLRNEILPRIRHRDPKILTNLSRSLELMVASSQTQEGVFVSFENGISRVMYLELAPVLREQLVYRYLQTLGVPDVRHSQVKEICRQLDKARRVDTFKVAHCEWIINAGQVEARVLK